MAAAQALPDWIFTHTPCRRIVTNIPTTNRLALHFALRAGMRLYGSNSASYLKNGELLDQICLGLSPGDGTAHGEVQTALGSFETTKVEV